MVFNHYPADSSQTPDMAFFDESRIRYFARDSMPRYDYSVFAYGDSLTAGYCNAGFSFCPYAKAVEASASNVLCDHLGLSGWTAREMVIAGTFAYTLACAAKHGARYDVAILMAGTNDLGRRGAAQIAEDIWKLHRSAHALGVPTIAIGVPGSHAQKCIEDIAKCADAVNKSLEEQCRAEPLATYIPCPIPYDETSALWEDDGLHMSGVGYEALGAALLPHILAVVQRS